MKNNEEIVILFEKYLKWESANFFMLNAISEKLERRGLKNSSKYLKAIMLSRQLIIGRFYRNLQLPENEIDALYEIKNSLKKEKKELLESIEEEADKKNLAGCIQTISFSKIISEKEYDELEKIINNVSENKDIIANKISVCPLCGLVMLEEYDRCPVCGANNATFRIF